MNRGTNQWKLSPSSPDCQDGRISCTCSARIPCSVPSAFLILYFFYLKTNHIAHHNITAKRLIWNLFLKNMLNQSSLSESWCSCSSTLFGRLNFFWSLADLAACDFLKISAARSFASLACKNCYFLARHRDHYDPKKKQKEEKGPSTTTFHQLLILIGYKQRNNTRNCRI